MSSLTDSLQDFNKAEGYFDEGRIVLRNTDPSTTFEVDPSALDSSLLDKENVKGEKRLVFYNQGIRAAEKLENKALVKKLKRCRDYLTVLTDLNNHITGYRPSHRCSSVLCPDCRRNKGQKAVKRHLAFMMDYVQENPDLVACHLTLTMKDDDREWKRKSLLEQQQWIAKSMARWRDKKDWQRIVRGGGIYGMEATVNIEHDRWHTHVHLLIFRHRDEFWDQKEIEREWFKVTRGFGGFVWIKQIDPDNMKGALRECLKYPYKMNDVDQWSPRLIRQVLACKNKKSVGTFGGYRKHRLSRDILKTFFDEERPQEGDLCRVCGEVLFSARWHEQYFRKQSMVDQSNAPPGRLTKDGPEVVKWQ